MSAWSEEQLRPIVREILAGLVDSAEAVAAPAIAAPVSSAGTAPIISSNDVMLARQSGRLTVPANAVVTPLAQEAAQRFGVTIVSGSHEFLPAARPMSAPSAASSSVSEAEGTPCFVSQRAVVAFAADHGGFELKATLMLFVEQLGLSVVDCGTYSKSSCDYPDFALAAAQKVAIGEAHAAIVIDGAGIGSCMAANKVPGVLAATVHNVATAKNSREHNGANVLSLGSGQVSVHQAREIVEAWLRTPFGGGRHGRRVNKIKAIEQAFTK